MIRIIYLFVLLLGIFQESNAQKDTVFEKKNYPAISANFQFGNVIPTTDFVKGDNLNSEPIDNYHLYTIKMLWQNPAYTDWQKVYSVPYYGFGTSLGNFFNPDEVGYPISHYGILGIPIVRMNKLELYSEFQFGLTWNWEHYDSITNPKNLVIGGELTVHLNIGVNAYYPLTKNIDLGAGVSFIHFSNGGFERPNRGFNIYAASLEMKYHFNNRPDTRSVPKPGRLERSNDLYLMLGYGDHQLVEHELDTNYFAVGGITGIYFTQLSNAFRLGYGTDINYWWGLNSLENGTPGPYAFENFTVGLLIQPEFIIDRLTLVSGFGIYAIHRNYGNFKQTYQRLGIRYEFYKNLSFGVNVRAVDFMLAEFLEFNLGYRFKWFK